VASNYPDEGQPACEGGDEAVRLPFRGGGPGQPTYAEARAEVRDRETYYAELRFAVHCQSRSIPAPRAALDDLGSDTWIQRGAAGRTDGESWDEMIARFGDTWT
jgi:hypothetical protein